MHLHQMNIFKNVINDIFEKLSEILTEKQN